MTGPPAYPADAHLAAMHLARIYDGTDVPDPGRIHQWATRLRVWAHRYPDRVHTFGRVARKTIYDLVEVERLAADILTDEVDARRSSV